MCFQHERITEMAEISNLKNTGTVVRATGQKTEMGGQQLRALFKIGNRLQTDIRNLKEENYHMGNAIGGLQEETYHMGNAIGGLQKKTKNTDKQITSLTKRFAEMEKRMNAK